MPNSLDSILQAAFDSQLQGRFEEAEALCDEALKKEPASLDAKLLLGIVAARKGDMVGALALLAEVTDVAPQNGIALHWSAAVHREMGDYVLGAELGERAVRALPNDPEVVYNFGLCLAGLKRNHEAAECLERAVQLNPKNPVYFEGLGYALKAAGRVWEARKAFERAVSLAPSLASCSSLAQLYFDEIDLPKAIRLAQQALAIDPNAEYAQWILSEARAEAEGGGEMATNELASKYRLPAANRLQFLGRRKEAHVAYQALLEEEPPRGGAAFGWFSSAPPGSEEHLISRLEVLAGRTLPAEETALVHYALGKAHDQAGHYQQAMQHWDEANKFDLAARPGWKFDLGAHQARTDETISRYSKAFIESNTSLGSESVLPIFVVGMIRSGTTLTEQLLSNHSRIGGAGEHGFWPRAEQRIVNPKSGQIDAKALRDMCRAYVYMLGDICPGKPHVIDKNPANFTVLGLLRIAFPNSKIIHIRRNPVDTCISIYSTPMQNPLEFALIRANIVEGYRDYLRFLAHWRAVLPAEQFLEIDYEDLIREPQETVASVLQFCDVPWEEACLHPEANTRRVDTPSFAQVRKPINTASLERWKHYEPWLDEFSELLVV